MLAQITSFLGSIVSFISLVFRSVVDFFTAIPKFLGFISDMFTGVPTVFVAFCGIALSLMLCNKILNLI